VAALDAADELGLPVLGWTLPRAVAEQLNEELGTGFIGHAPGDVDLVVPVERDRQRVASLAHASQAVPTSVLWRRLELLGDAEHLRWLRRVEVLPTMRVDYLSGDRFDISIRDHVVAVDQPVEVGGEDEGPTPTELYVASLASCVAFYARRYLRRHHLDATGLSVEASYRLGTKPARVDRVAIRIHVPEAAPPGAPGRSAGGRQPLHRPQLDHDRPRDHYRSVTGRRPRRSASEQLEASSLRHAVT
jgi:hypothetical protein